MFGMSIEDWGLKNVWNAERQLSNVELWNSDDFNEKLHRSHRFPALKIEHLIELTVPALSFQKRPKSVNTVCNLTKCASAWPLQIGYDYPCTSFKD